MDSWKFYDICHRDHLIYNPFSLAKLDELVTLLDLPSGARVLDIACGKAELTLRLVERYSASGDAVDLSPFCVRDAREQARRRVPDGALVFYEQDGATFQAPPSSYDLAICLGASWTFDGHHGTLQALQRFTKPGGQVLVGEPYWRKEPDPAYFAAGGFSLEIFSTHAGNVAIGEELGLTPLYTIVSSDDDWDRYKGLQWRAAERYAAARPDDPDAAEIVRRQRAARERYLRWERDALGWAIYLFRAELEPATPAQSTTASPIS